MNSYLTDEDFDNYLDGTATLFLEVNEIQELYCPNHNIDIVRTWVELGSFSKNYKRYYQDDYYIQKKDWIKYVVEKRKSRRR